MFNNKGESKMNNPNNKVFLVIKKTSWSDGENWFDVAEHSKQQERAEQCIVALNTLNDDKRISYLMCEVANDNK
jgi:hypothetical protein